MAEIARWVTAHQPGAFVVDVSVEVALLVRLLGVRLLWIAQRGTRRDHAHRAAYGAASRLVAPWTAAVPEPDLARRPGVRYVGALSRFDDRVPTPLANRRRVLVLLGRGGDDVRSTDLAAAAEATPGWCWEVAGGGRTGSFGDARRLPGDVDVWERLCDTDVVISTAGTNIVSEVAAARRPLIVIPQQRPFGEQLAHATALARAALATSCETWPAPDRWPALLADAAVRDPGRWALLHDGRAAARLAAIIRELACGSG